MKLLLTSAGVGNPTLKKVLIDLAGKKLKTVRLLFGHILPNITVKVAGRIRKTG